MKREAEQVLCRFHLTNLARHGSGPLYEWIVATARADGLQGATVLKGFLGLRADGTLLQEKAWAPAQERPVIVEVVDGPGRIEALLARVEPALAEAMVTLERAHVVIYRGGAPDPEPEAVRPGDVTATRDLERGLGGEDDEATRGRRPPAHLHRRERSREGTRPPALRGPRAARAGGPARRRHRLKGPMGFGGHSRMHTARLLELSTDLPVVIEIVDAEEKVRGFLPVVDELVTEGLVTLEAVRIIKYVSPPA